MDWKSTITDLEIISIKLKLLRLQKIKGYPVMVEELKDIIEELDKIINNID